MLIGDASKAKTNFCWEPQYDLKALVGEMMASDMETFQRDKYLMEGGHKVLNPNE